MAKALTLLGFIERSNKIHDFGFDYSESEFINTRTPIKITCKTHNETFMQVPKSHLIGKTGCKQCTIEKKKHTCLENHGVENPSQSEEIKQKKIDTCLENHGVEYTLQSEKLREQIKETCIKKFGVENPNQCSEVREKIEKTNNKRYGYKTPLQNSTVKEKIKQTNLKNRGVEYPMQSAAVREKSRLSNLDIRGVEYSMQDPNVREKVKQTNLKNRGVEYSMQDPAVREKAKQTNLKNLGVENPMQSLEVRKKVEETNIKRYGYKTPLQNLDIKEKIKQTNLERYDVEYVSQRNISKETLEKLSNIEYLTDQHHVQKKSLTEIAYELKVTPKTVADNVKRLNIKIIRHPRSQMERDLVTLIETHSDYKIITNSHEIISNELDIFLPELNFAIEVNGDFFHSELKGKGRNYHLNKFLECKELGINLIHLWEHDWVKSKEIILSLVLSKIGKISNKINARECSLNEIDNNLAKSFFNENHLHGYVNSSINLGLFKDDILVSVMSFSKNRFGNNEQYEMTRFASKIYTNVRGATGKLFKHFVKNYNPESIITYAYRELFTGKVYENIGFEFSHSSLPNYHYFHKSNTFKLFSRLKFQKHKLSKILEHFDSELSEWQNMQNNGYDRIWDCGNNVYVFKR